MPASQPAEKAGCKVEILHVVKKVGDGNWNFMQMGRNGPIDEGLVARF